MVKSDAASLFHECPVHAVTPLLDLPALATSLGVGRVLVKDEGARPLGSFRALGGVYAGLRALARSAGIDVAAAIAQAGIRALPELICASDGNHGLAVAAAARLAGTRARVFLPEAVSPVRVERIRAKGGEPVIVRGTYEDAVAAAADHARATGAILIADTSADPADPVVADVMAGYGIMADEISAQLPAAPTHLFLQAGVGGLAAAIAERLEGQVVVVEPASAACVATALAAGRIVTFPGDLATAAEMLSCGEASAPAMTVLRRRGAQAIAVSESELADAPGFLRAHGGPATTPSGACGLAGLRHVMADAALAKTLGLGPTSTVLLIATERG
jgi:diaminopropionate ammonia-lyase